MNETTIIFKCKIITTDPSNPMKFMVYIDENKIFDEFTTEPEYTLEYMMDDSIELMNHKISFILDEKTDDHTVINNGMVESSAEIIIQDVTIENIDISSVISSNAIYYHSYNDKNKEIINDTFYDHMGFNGRVDIHFSTPVYPWLLENLS